MRLILTFLLFQLATIVFGQNELIKYTLKYSEGAKLVDVIIEFDSVNTTNTQFIIPRSAPGTYEITDYSRFVENVKAETHSGEVLLGLKGRGSFYNFEKDEVIKRISYRVNIVEMETELTGGFASSKSRANYLGILGYSVFGTMSGTSDKPIVLTIETNAQWPIFTTLNPTKQYQGKLSVDVDNYAALVDAQYLLGSSVQIYQVKEADIPLIIAVYAEVPIDIEEIGRRGLISLRGLADYFEYIPMPHYTICYEFLVPYSNGHNYGFSMEHLNSMTASMDTSRAINMYEPKPRIGSMVHHMGHSWIPLRSYGKGYRPFDWGTAPIIETIWLNEGFIWYVMTKVLNNTETIKFFENVVSSAPEFIKEKSLKELSQLGSSQYSSDFDIGRNLFSRGALMAYEMDQEIKQQTNDQKSFKDALLGLLKWTEQNQRAYDYHEIEPILSNSTGVDLSVIWNKWQTNQEN